MKIRNVMLATASMAFAVCITGSVSAQDATAPARRVPPSGPPTTYKAPIRHRLYIATPGDEGADGQSGVIVLDADHDYRFVKRLPYDLSAAEMPGPKISGMTSSIPANMIYVTTDGGSMIAFDLKTDKIAWTFYGEGKNANVPVTRRGAAGTGCCERPYTMPNDGGKTLMVASAYNHWWYEIDAVTGKVLGKIDTPEEPNSHNLTITADGKLGMFSPLSPPPHANVAVVDIPNKKVLCNIAFSDAPRPLTMNHDGSLIYVNVNNLDGFEIGDTKTCKMIKRVELPAEMWKARWANPNGHAFGHGLPSHGIGLTPDESEIWVTDGANDAWQIWDNPGDGRNPVYNPLKTVKVQENVGGSAWISMTNDGKLAFTGDGSVIDVKAHKVIATLKDEYGRNIHAVEKVLYMAMQDGHIVETSNQFAIGNAEAYRARMSAQQASR
jgi:DNA-binding beta-propeller fold protein YncE